jgi:hypothetical protein
VSVTFDDAVNIINIETYRDTLYRRRNTNGCAARATFYVSHEYTNYQLINELYNNGMEIALHSISHQTPQSYWAQATPETIKKEFADQRLLMSHFANIPVNAIQGKHNSLFKQFCFLSSSLKPNETMPLKLFLMVS